jgi:hypothetical protein
MLMATYTLGYHQLIIPLALMQELYINIQLMLSSRKLITATRGSLQRLLQQLLIPHQHGQVYQQLISLKLQA